MENHSKTRIYGKNIETDGDAAKELYSTRAEKSGQVHVDAPTVLSSDANIENIRLWTEEELRRWFPLFGLSARDKVFEIGFGTGRMTKYITAAAGEYVGIDYVEPFLKTVLARKDIEKKESTKFYTASLQEFLKGHREEYSAAFNKVFLSGGVFMYINDRELCQCLEGLADMLKPSCLVYISEPVAIFQRLTLDSFYSETIKDDYSAIYRTEEEYREIFRAFTDRGFELEVSQEFFENDIKKMKETKQWIFILKR